MVDISEVGKVVANWYRYKLVANIQRLLNEGVSNGGAFPIWTRLSPCVLLIVSCGIFPICPFPLSRPINGSYKEQSRKCPRHNPDLSQKVENPTVWKPPKASAVVKHCDFKCCSSVSTEGWWALFLFLNEQLGVLEARKGVYSHLRWQSHIHSPEMLETLQWRGGLGLFTWNSGWQGGLRGRLRPRHFCNGRLVRLRSIALKTPQLNGGFRPWNVNEMTLLNLETFLFRRTWGSGRTQEDER